MYVCAHAYGYMHVIAANRIPQLIFQETLVHFIATDYELIAPRNLITTDIAKYYPTQPSRPYLH